MEHPTPRIHPTARIARNAVVTGDVELGARCTVLFNAVVRGDCAGRIAVGENTNIQEGACLHVCTIGDGTLVGMGAIVIDGARVGKRCLIGAGALVTGTADIPDGMLAIGSPARAVRPLTPEELAGLEESVQEYLQVGDDLVEQGLLVCGGREA